MPLLRSAETRLRKMENEEARSWRLRSRQKWLREGEAPSRYAQTRTKYVRESIQNLRQEDGQTVNDRKEIINQVQAYYTALYTRELNTEEILILLKTDETVFYNAKEIITSFEKASGACFNLQKTTIIPLSEDPVPPWLTATGCRIANAEDRFRRINHWATKLLTWPAKLILCRNVLGALPYYTLTTVGLSTQGMTLLQKATRDFLWGQNEMGRNKKPLIAWKHFERRKEDGGWTGPPSRTWLMRLCSQTS
ncbi:hypothetical protein R1sor_005483 [Riccia sorocarpa]|uniref:Reverse transcriptase n=1 Tax=Riccia sorocarpa TaxID=122646 RepID=A0ABD3HJZ5_9MARC